MGSNAQRKTSSVGAASSKALNLHGYGGAGSKNMKRQRLLSGSSGAATWDHSAESNNIAAASLEESAKSKKRFVGVRQRPSGRWVAEIKDTTQKIRLWLGTFDSAEEGAKAYDSAARALRGANTRTNFVTTIACEGMVPATTSKAARLIRLRQIAAANSKACEKLEAEQKLGHGANQSISPLLRQDLNQQSISSDLDRLPRSTANVDDRHSQVTTPPRLISSSPLKPARQIGRRHNASPVASSAKSEQERTAPLLTLAEDNGPELDSLIQSSPLKLAPQPSAITSETLSNAINHSLIVAASPQDHHLSSLSRLSLDKRNQPNSTPTPSTSAGEEVPSLHKLVELAATDIHLKCKAVDDGSEIQRREPAALENSSVSTFAVEKSLPTSPPKQQSFPCSSNRADVSLYGASEMDSAARYGDNNEGLIFIGIDSNPSVSLDDGRAPCKVDAGSSLQSYESTFSPPTSTTLREKELHPSGSELLLAPDAIPWPDYVLVDGLDLSSCETNCGVYTSAFDFSAEAMDRDSCTSSMMLEDQQYLSDDSTEFLLTMPAASPLPGPPLSPPEPESGAQSSGSTDVTMDGDGGGECSSQDQALWSSMDLAPLCMAA